VSVQARLQAKVKTWLQDIAVGLAIAPVAGHAYRGVLLAVLWSAVALTLLTGGQYLWDGRRVVRGV